MLAVGKRLSVFLILILAYSLIVGVVVTWWNIRLNDWGAAAGFINSIILSLLLSFRNRTAYERWWEARKLWGQLTNDCRNLACKLAAFVPAEALASSPAYALLSSYPEALKRHLRGESPRLRDLAGFEQAKDDPAHLPSYLAGRLFTVVADWRREGVIGDAVVWVLDPHLRALLDICGGCERIRNTPLSRSYKALLRAGLVLNILAAPWYATAEIGFWSVPVFEIVCFFLLGVELIDSIIEEPFGREADDLDLDGYCQTIRDSVSASLSGRADLRSGN
jgi:putative membrane protein